MKPHAIEITNVTKRFPGVLAADDITLTVRKGEIHCLVGENGAGKSTIIKIMSGQYKPDVGEVSVDGEAVSFSSPLDARRAGISVIHQELQLVPMLSTSENIVLGRWPNRFGLVDRGTANELSERALDRVGLDLDPSREVLTLSTGQQQLVEIARALSFESKVLILDEPTASLSGGEVRTLLDIVLQLKNEGIGILYVSHRLEEVFELADTITVLRDGKLVGSGPVDEFDESRVVNLMVGGDTTLFVEKDHVPSDTLLRVSHLTRQGAFEDVSFEVRAGEVVGFGGLIGAGRTEVMRCVFGLDAYNEGNIELAGKPIKIDSPQKAVQNGIGLVPEDRKTQGLVLILSVAENIELSSLDSVSRAGWIDDKRERSLVSEYIRSLHIKTPSAQQIVGALSGGNQQKVVLARCLATRPRLLILDEPTRGVDVNAKAEIHRLIEELVREGLGVVVVSSDLPELLDISDRIYVMRKGKIVRELKGEEISKTAVMRYAAGATQAAPGRSSQ